MKIYIILFVFILLGCYTQQANYTEIKNAALDSDLNLKYSPFTLNSEDIVCQIFDTYSSKDGIFLVIFNKVSESIELYDLEKNELKSHSKYKNLLGDEEIYGGLNSVEFHNYDSIFFLQNNLISLADTSNVYKTIEINYDSLEYENLTLMNLDHAPLYYDDGQNSLSIQSYCYSCYLHDKSYYLSPIHVSFSLDDHSFSELPITFSKKYLEDYYGFHNFVHRKEYEDKYLISFSIDPNLYMYDKKNGEIIIKGGRSKYQSKDINTLNKRDKNDSNKKLKHITLEPIYKEFLYDKYRDMYYRFLLTGIKEKNEDGTFNAWRDKELILMIFDNKLNLVKEESLGKGIYNSAMSFITKQGLYLSKFNDADTSLLENKLNYDILQISK